MPFLILFTIIMLATAFHKLVLMRAVNDYHYSNDRSKRSKQQEILDRHGYWAR
jgi:hypothetical protein